MKHICKICGYIYNDDEQAAPFAELPNSWTCPLCGATKSDFERQGETKAVAERSNAHAKVDNGMRKLSVGELAAVCSNLARGCEKQYKQEESELFTELAKYFSDITPAEESARAAEISKMLQHDLESGYGEIRSTAGRKKDRGALRVCVWGEKVTRILNTLLQRYEKEGEALLADTEIWVCTTCGFVYIGDKPPELCPVCKVASWKFQKIERRVKR